MGIACRQRRESVVEAGMLPSRLFVNGRNLQSVSIIAKYLYEELPEGYRLRETIATCIASGLLQSSYNPTPDDSLWRVGRHALPAERTSAFDPATSDSPRRPRGECATSDVESKHSRAPRGQAGGPVLPAKRVAMRGRPARGGHLRGTDGGGGPGLSEFATSSPQRKR